MSKLTNEQIDACWGGLMPSGHGKSRYDIARFIEAAACAERDARIAYLERVLVQAQYAMQYHMDQTRPIFNTQVAIAAIDEALKENAPATPTSLYKSSEV